MSNEYQLGKTSQRYIPHN